MSQPQLHVLAGPNGSGKSTYAEAWKRNFTIHNPDEVVKTLGQHDGNALIAAGRIIHRRIDDDLKQRATFGIETTLSGHQVLRTMAACRNSGYRVFLHFIYVEKLILSRARVAERVKSGGHGVPEDDQLRRFPRSFENLPKAIALSNVALIFNNSGVSHQLVAVYHDRQNVYRTVGDAWLPQSA
jgi:predicted ABC-type ATPase